MPRVTGDRWRWIVIRGVYGIFCVGGIGLVDNVLHVSLVFYVFTPLGGRGSVTRVTGHVCRADRKRVLFVSSFSSVGSGRGIMDHTLSMRRGGKGVIQLTGKICLHPGGAQFKVICPSVSRVIVTVTRQSGMRVRPSKIATLGGLKLSARIPAGCACLASKDKEILALKGQAVRLGEDIPGGFTFRAILTTLLMRTLEALKRGGMNGRRLSAVEGLIGRRRRGSLFMRSLALVPM